jgi:hypothetical protein
VAHKMPGRKYCSPCSSRVPSALDLVLALNALFDRLSDGFDALGSYAVSASHELGRALVLGARRIAASRRSTIRLASTHRRSAVEVTRPT